MAWLRHVGSTGEDKGLDKALSRLRAGWNGLLVKHAQDDGKPIEQQKESSVNGGGGLVIVKVSPARFSLNKAVRVKLQVGAEEKTGKTVVESKPTVVRGEQVVRLSVLPARFGRRAVRVRLSVEEVATGPVSLQLSPARFGDRVKVQLKVLDESEDEAGAAKPGCIGGRLPASSTPSRPTTLPGVSPSAAATPPAPLGPVSVKLTQNWRGRVKLHTTVKEPSHEDRLVQLLLHHNRITRKVAAKLVVL